MASQPANQAGRPSRLVVWGRLLRVPNLFTVPGDPIAGFLLASGGMASPRMAWAALVSLCLYAAGLLLNDYFDRDVDALERPDRPIPSNVVRMGTVLAASIFLLVGGPVIALAEGGTEPGLVAAVLALLVVAYDKGLKNVPGLGPVVMGACRGGSVLLGAAFATGTYSMPPVVIAACVAWAYTASLTFIAAGETSGRKPGRTAYVPGLLLLAGALAMLKCSMRNCKWPLMALAQTLNAYNGSGGAETVRFVDRAGVAAALLLVLAIAEAEWAAFRVRQGRLPTPAFIGRLIRVMITVQAAWVAWTFGPVLGPLGSEGLVPCVIVALLLVRLGAGLTARRFYGS